MCEKAPRSSILSQAQLESLWELLPPLLEPATPQLLYDNSVHGYSLERMFARLQLAHGEIKDFPEIGAQIVGTSRTAALSSHLRCDMCRLCRSVCCGGEHGWSNLRSILRQEALPSKLYHDSQVYRSARLFRLQVRSYGHSCAGMTILECRNPSLTSGTDICSPSTSRCALAQVQTNLGSCCDSQQTLIR